MLHYLKIHCSKAASKQNWSSCVFGSSEKAWKLIEAKNTKSGFYMGLGLHPWFLETQPNFIELERLLMKHKEAFLGEIGLDKNISNKLQLPVFKTQLSLAAKLERPAYVHNVQKWGNCLEIFQDLNKFVQGCPPAILFHSYSGSKETARQLLNLPNIGNRFYFSFSNKLLNIDKSDEVIDIIPENRILVESDLELNAEEDLLDLCKKISKIKNWTSEETIEITFQNSVRFYNFRST